MNHCLWNQRRGRPFSDERLLQARQAGVTMPNRAHHHTIVALVENKPGVLNRIASKWRQRGFNIESLAVGHSEIPGLSRMTFTVDGAKHDVDQVDRKSTR